MISPRRAAAFLPAAAFLLVVGILTLRPIPGQAAMSHMTPWWCLLCGALGTVDVLLNVLLFVPFGVALRLTGARPGSIALIGLGVSVAIELLQWKVIPGRDASISDVITNTVGTLLGGLVATGWRAFLVPDRRTALRLAAAGALGWGAVWGVSARLLRPSPPDGDYYGQWAHDFMDRPQWGGRVLHADLNGLAIPDDRTPSEPLRSALRSGEFELTVRARSGPAVWPDAQIFGLASGEAEIFVEWAQVGRDLSFKMRYRTSDIRVRSPKLRFDGAAPADSGSPLVLLAGQSRGVLSAEVQTATDTVTARHRLTPSLNWTFLLPFGYGWGFETRWVSVLWVIVSLAPVAYWGTRAGSFRRALLATGVAAVIGLGLAPSVGRLPAVHWSEWVGALLGCLLGVLASRAARPGPRRVYPPSARSAVSP